MYKFTKINSLFICILLSLILLCTPQVISANEADKFSIGGFVSQGVVHTSDNRFFDKKDDTSFNMTEASLQANYQLSSNIRISGQVMYRNWGKLENSTLDYLMVDYHFLATNTSNMGIRLGRIKNDFGLYNLTRNIPSARPSIFLPQSIYSDIFRDTVISSDGVSLYANHHFSTGNLSWHFTYGKYPVSDDLFESILGDSIKGEFSAPHYTRYVKFTWEPTNGDWLISLGYSDPLARFEQKLEPSDIFGVSEGEFTYESLLLSYQYFTENWDFSTEYERKYIDGKGFELYIPNIPDEFQPDFPPLFKPRYVNDTFYAQWRYLLSDKLTLMLRYGKIITDNNDRKGKEFAASSSANIPAFSQFTNNFTSGVSWQISDNWRVDIEGHYFEGTAVISPMVKTDTNQNSNKYWQLWTLQASYSF